MNKKNCTRIYRVSLDMEREEAQYQARSRGKRATKTLVNSARLLFIPRSDQRRMNR
jgi:hypothetical protein